MATIPIRPLAMILAVALGTAAARAGDAKTDSPLLGTWRAVRAKYDGKEAKREAGFTHVKHITPAGYLWAIHDKEGTVTIALGGTYTVNGDEYVELPEYGTAKILQDRKGTPQVFKWKIKGARLYLEGRRGERVVLEEEWERVQRPKIAKEDLVGRWKVVSPKDANMTMEFTRDGKHRLDFGSSALEWTYVLNGSHVTLTSDQGAITLTKRATIKKLTTAELEIDIEGVSEKGKPETYSYKLTRVTKK